MSENSPIVVLNLSNLVCWKKTQGRLANNVGRLIGKLGGPAQRVDATSVMVPTLCSNFANVLLYYPLYATTPSLTTLHFYTHTMFLFRRYKRSYESSHVG